MGMLYLVRHGQASFGTDDYDRLSDLGHRQSQRLGAHWAAMGMKLDHVITGTLLRQRQTWQGMAQGGAGAPWAALEPETTEALNEYDSHALLEAWLGQPPVPSAAPEMRRLHFQQLRDALGAWMAAEISPRGMPSYQDWVAGMLAVVERVRHNQAERSGATVIVSSGGPIATLITQVLGAPPASAIELNLQIRNSAVAELLVSPKRVSVVSVNGLPHLQQPDLADWVSYA